MIKGGSPKWFSLIKCELKLSIFHVMYSFHLMCLWACDENSSTGWIKKNHIYYYRFLNLPDNHLWSRQDNFKTKHLCKIRITANKAKCKRQWKCITLKAVNTKPTINCKMPWQTCFHYQWKNLSKSIISVMSAFPLSSSHKTWIKESTEGSVTPSRGEALVKVNGRMWS